MQIKSKLRLTFVVWTVTGSIEFFNTGTKTDLLCPKLKPHLEKLLWTCLITSELLSVKPRNWNTSQYMLTAINKLHAYQTNVRIYDVKVSLILDTKFVMI